MTAPENSFAVIELFTSEGCSSCPAADKLLSEIILKSALDEKPVYALAFHVTYWDRLGWKDKYGDRAYSERQGNYAMAFGKQNVYTPQMIINGTNEFTGSNKSKAYKGIETALATSAEATINIQSRYSNVNNILNVDFKVENASDHHLLNLAIVEKDLVSNIGRGENKGRTLRHDNVVRHFTNLDINGKNSGNVNLHLSEDINLKNASLIAYLQHKHTMEIIGATGTTIN